MQAARTTTCSTREMDVSAMDANVILYGYVYEFEDVEASSCESDCKILMNYNQFADISSKRSTRWNMTGKIPDSDEI